MMRRGRVHLLGLVVTVLLMGGVAAIATSTVTTLQGVNFQVSSRKIPLYVKGLDFLHRHYQYQMYANEITRGLGSNRERVLAVFDWTRRNIRRTPEDWPVMDDHVLNIIIRGHGLGDQMADVFTTLSTYAGVPAYWRKFRAASGAGLILSFARVEGKWVLFDVANGLILRNSRGDLASTDEVAADPRLVAVSAGDLRVNGVPYHQYFSRFTPPAAPRPLRAELQMPWPRLWYEVQRAVGRERQDGS